MFSFPFLPFYREETIEIQAVLDKKGATVEGYLFSLFCLSLSLFHTHTHIYIYIYTYTHTHAFLVCCLCLSRALFLTVLFHQSANETAFIYLNAGQDHYHRLRNSMSLKLELRVLALVCLFQVNSCMNSNPAPGFERYNVER